MVEADDRAAAPRVRRVRHVVRRGETVAGLAERFDVSPAQFRRWNELTRKQQLKPGRTVVVLVPAAQPPAAVATVAVPVPRPARALPSAEETMTRQALAAANAQEVARVAAVAAQEQQQALRLAKVRQRQEAAQHAQARIAAVQAAVLAKTTAALAGRKSAEPVALASAPAETERLVASNEAGLGAPTEAPEVAAPNPRRAPAEATARPRDTAAEVEPTPTATGSYVVRRGDNLTKLAQAHGASVAQLVAWNHLDTETVEAGQRLRFRAPAGAPAKAAAVPLAAVPKTHRVQPGDTLYNISRRFGVSVAVLRRLNHLTSDDVKLGQKLLVPQG